MTTEFAREAIEVEKDQPQHTDGHVSAVCAGEHVEGRAKDAVLNRETLVEKVGEFKDLTAQEN